MKKIMLLSLFAMGLNKSTFCQTFDLVLNSNCINKTNAKKVHCFDTRDNKELLGFFQIGWHENITWVVNKRSLSNDLLSFFTIDSLKQYDYEEVAIIIDEIFMHEQNGSILKSGNLRLGIRIFAAKEPNRFQEKLTIENEFTVQLLLVAKQFLPILNEKLCIMSSDLKASKNEVIDDKPYYSLAELQTLDSIEKSKIPIFIADKPKAGIFRSYESLMANEPDSASIKIDHDGKIFDIVYTLHGGKTKPTRLFVDSIYAVSNGENIFIATKRGFVKTVKTGLDYLLVRQDNTKSKCNTMYWEILLANWDAKQQTPAAKKYRNSFSMKLNHVNGKVVLGNN